MVQQLFCFFLYTYDSKGLAHDSKGLVPGAGRSKTDLIVLKNIIFMTQQGPAYDLKNINPAPG